MPAIADDLKKYERTSDKLTKEVGAIIGANELPPKLAEQIGLFTAAVEELRKAEDVPVRDRPTTTGGANIARKRGEVNRTQAGVKREFKELTGIFVPQANELNLALGAYFDETARVAGIELGRSGGGGS